MYNVTLQRQYPDGDLVVEVGVGDYNYANPGQIGKCYEFEDPREAVKLALTIAQTEEAARREIVEVAHGYTMGMTMPFSPCEPDELIAWAEEEWEELPKCSYCGGARDPKHSYRLEQLEEDECCSPECADNLYQSLLEWCPAHQGDVFNEGSVADHGVCWGCHEEIKAGDRCGLCYEEGHDSSRCPDNPDRIANWLVKTWRAGSVTHEWIIKECTEREAEEEAAVDVERYPDYQVDDWTTEEVEDVDE